MIGVSIFVLTFIVWGIVESITDSVSTIGEKVLTYVILLTLLVKLPS